MSTSVKKATSIRINKDLYDYLRKLAKQEHRSLNNFIEIVLSRATKFDVPNADTIKAMKEVELYGSSLKSYPDADSLFRDLEASDE